MAFIFNKDEAERDAGPIHLPETGTQQRTLRQDTLYIMTMVFILYLPPSPNQRQALADFGR